MPQNIASGFQCALKESDVEGLPLAFSSSTTSSNFKKGTLPINAYSYKKTQVRFLGGDTISGTNDEGQGEEARPLPLSSHLQRLSAECVLSKTTG